MPRARFKSAVAGERGTASVELIATVPFLLLALLVAAQVALAGHALWSASVGARAGARARLVGGDAGQAARAALPPALRDDAEVRERDDGGVEVRVRVPALVPRLPEVSVSAGAGLGGEGG